MNNEPTRKPVSREAFDRALGNVFGANFVTCRSYADQLEAENARLREEIAFLNRLINAYVRLDKSPIVANR